MPMKYIFVFASFLFFSQLLVAQAERLHPIDSDLENCLEKEENYTTRGMVKCIQSASERWDKELNVQYKTLGDLLTEEQFQQIRKAQRNWMKYRDAEFEFIDNYFSRIDGSVRNILSATKKMEIVKSRTKELRAYIEFPEIEEK